jgi:hypothetical protein
MDAPTLLCLAIIVAAALLGHRLIAYFPLAWAVAAVSSAVPALLVFEISGAARTGFMPMTAFALLVVSALASALLGLPFAVWRWYRKLPMDAVALPAGMPWAMLGGMLCAALALVLPVLLWRGMGSVAETLVFGSFSVGFLGTILSAFAGTLFLTAAALAGGSPETLHRRQFQLGVVLAAAITVPMLLAPLLLASWPPNAIMALELNLAFWIAGLGGLAYGRRSARETPSAMPRGNEAA